MGWQDREYNREQPTGNPFMWLLSGSLPMGTWFGIPVRMHASMLILIVLTLIFPQTFGSPKHALTFLLILFSIVLLHEMGHCIASRMVGGNPSDIVIYPLGGLASAGAPFRPWANFVAVAGGPLVNVIICIITGGWLMLLSEHVTMPWNPLKIGFAYFIHSSTLGYYLWWIFTVSYGLLLFNLWPVFPLDGGQLVQSLLWVKIGYYRSMIFATITGMIGACIMAAVGILYGAPLLLFIAISGFLTCIQMYYATKQAGPYGFTEEPSYTVTPHRKHSSKWALRRARKLEREEKAEQIKIDAILAKVSAHGMHSLTWFEKRALKKATEHQRQRDAEFARGKR